MIKSYQYLDIDINKKTYRRLRAVQGDSKSRYILVSLYDNSKAYNLSNCSVKVFGCKSDKKIFFNYAIVTDVVNGKFEIELTNQALAVAGELEIQILILGTNQERLTSFSFYIDVEKSIVNDGVIESANEFKALTGALSQVEEWNGYFEETSGKIEEKYTERLNNVDSQLEQNMNKINEQFNTNVNKISKGLLIDASNKIKSASIYLPVSDVSTEEQFINILNKCKDSNCNTITICPIFWMTSSTSNTFDGYKSPLTESIVIERIKKAKELGFKVALKPHVGGVGISGHANIQPSDLGEWITNYTNLYVNLLKQVKDYVDIVCVGNELNDQTNQLKVKWDSLVSEIRGIKEELIVGHACHFGELTTNVFLDKLDFIGCNMYVPVTGNLSTNIEVQRKSIMNITNSINELFAKGDELSKPIIITEVGILPFVESLSQPEKWGFDPTPTVVEDVQVRYYNIALKEYLNANNVLGTFIWNACDGYTFIDRKAQETVKELYGGVVNV